MSALGNIHESLSVETYTAAEEHHRNIALRLLGALDAILALHQPILKDGAPVGCVCCDWNVRGNDVWPCRTIAAVNDVLEAGK